MNHGLGLLIESLVAVLLMVTIGYCVLLNRRLQRLKSDEHTLKATIAELVSATQIAERAISGLKLTVRDCDQDLGERLRNAERLSSELDRQIEAGEGVVSKLGRIVAATRGPAEAPPSPDTRAMLVAAQAFAERARSRADGLAA